MFRLFECCALSFFERFVLSFSLKIERFVSDSAEIWICGLYIDIWATWCGPCQREIPHLQKLEEKYHGKDIYFVSISCDNNKKAWENRVRAGLKGIQLHFVNGDTFMNDYMIKGIPRFILLDKEGKIISVDMSRPSDPKTIAKLDELLN